MDTSHSATSKTKVQAWNLKGANGSLVLHRVVGKAGNRLCCADPVRTLGLLVFHRKFVLSGDSKMDV